MDELLQAALERIKSRIRIDDKGCWNWLGGITKDHYGSIRVGRKVMSTHRVAFLAVNGPIARGKVIRHTCDNRGCCNPAHLVTGDHEDNTQDIVDRGRVRARRVLTAEEIALVATMWAAKSTKRQIAEALKCNWYAVSAVIDSISAGQAKRLGRPRGSRNLHVRVNDDMKKEIRALYATGAFTQAMLAEKFACDQTYISLIVRGLK